MSRYYDMRLVRKECPDPTGNDLRSHHHWSLRGKNYRVSWGLWFDYDHKNFGCPIEININTPKVNRMIRPFTKTQRWVVSSQRPGMWEKIQRYG